MRTLAKVKIRSQKTLNKILLIWLNDLEPYILVVT